MFFSEFPFVRYALALAIGIGLYPSFSNVNTATIAAGIFGLYIVYVCLVWQNRRKRNYRFRALLPLLAYVQLVLSGVLACSLKDIRNQADHLLYSAGEVKYLMGVTMDWDEAKPRSRMNRVRVTNVFPEGKDGVQGEILLYHQFDTLLGPGQVLLLAGKPSTIEGPKNPGQFDYRTFMERQGLAHSLFSGKKLYVLGSVIDQPIQQYFSYLRNYLIRQIDQFFESPASKQIAKALLLGYKKQMDPEITEAYSTTGAMHILAVSGLHVGIIYGFFFLLVKPYRLRTRIRVVYLTSIILLIWAYACLTGLSPSVLRSATMFTFVALAQMQSRSPSIFNAIALSALVLLVLDPFLLYAVGFQLSYGALLGILLIQPLLVRVWLPRYRWLEYCWQITTVGVAAQLATFPISAYYFHQFPSYFILSNLVAIPAAFLIMSFGIPFLIFSKVPVLGPALTWVTESLIKMLNFLIMGLESLPGASVRDIHFEVWEIVLYFLLIGVGVLLWNFPKKSTIWFMVALLGVFGFARLGTMCWENLQSESIRYALDKGLALDIFQDGQLWVWEDSDARELEFKVKPNRSRRVGTMQFALLAFSKDDQNLILGPPGRGMIDPDSFPEGNGTKSFAWENGSWTIRIGTIEAFGAMAIKTQQD